MPIELDALNGIDVDLRISAARVTLDGFNLGRTAVAANLRAGNLTLAIGESQAFGGVIKGSLALAKSTAGADLQAQLQFTRGDARPDARRASSASAGSKAAAISTSPCRGSGGSIYDLTKALNGIGRRWRAARARSRGSMSSSRSSGSSAIRWRSAAATSAAAARPMTSWR